MKNRTKHFIYITIDLSVPLYEPYPKNCFIHRLFFINLDTLCLKIGNAFTQWYLVPLWPTINQIIHHKHETFTKNLKTKHKKIARDLPNGPLCPFGRILFSQLNKLTKLRQRNSDDLLLKIFRSLTKKSQGINQIGLCVPWVDNYLHHCRLE